MEQPLFHFRYYEASDEAGVAALHRVLFPVRYDKQFFLNLLTPGYFAILAFSSAEELVGLVTGRLVDKQDYEWTCKDEILLFCKDPKPSGYIMTLGVSPQVRRHGLGSMLIQRMCEEFHRHHCESIWLHVKCDNNAAVQFYHKHGFQRYRRLQGYYNLNNQLHDAFLMRASWNPASSSFLYPLPSSSSPSWTPWSAAASNLLRCLSSLFSCCYSAPYSSLPQSEL
ncbi:Ribosomal-protein-alanine N-acetyltransferase [Balamuthia mandrillaris]